MQISNKHSSNLYPNNKVANCKKKKPHQQNNLHQTNPKKAYHHQNMPIESSTFILKASSHFKHILIKIYE